jgi:predicted nucleotidyltransferase
VGEAAPSVVPMSAGIGDDLMAAVIALQGALDELPGPSMLIGGIAVTLLGAPRFTRDIDATIAGASTASTALADTMRRHDIAPREGHSEEFARISQVHLYEHVPSAVPIDLSLAWLPFEEEALARARTLDVGTMAVRVADPSDLLVYKALAARARDLDDLDRLLTRLWDEIDFERVRRWLRRFDEVLEDASRLAIFDRAVADAQRLRG